MLWEISSLIALGFAAMANGAFFKRHEHVVHRDNGREHHVSLTANDPMLCDKNSYSGYFEAAGRDKYFYWFFESRDSPTNDPTIMWLTGGPGCSSTLALLVENGPCYVNDAATDTYLSETSWTNHANVIWVDQPPGTGFSTGSLDSTEDEIATDMYDFLQNFMAAFPQYFQNGFFVFGESYAGHYVPAVTWEIWNENNAGHNPNIPLKAFAIGNGLTDPYIQYAWYATMGYDSGTAPPAISESTYNAMTNHIPECQSMIQKCQSGSSADCTNAEDFCNEWEIEPVTITGVNPYDLRIPCEIPGLCYNFTNVDVWLNNETVQAALGVNMKWESCATLPHLALGADWMKEYQGKLSDLLNSQQVRGLIYAGDQDFICNWIGNKHWALEFNWNGNAAFNAATDKDWTPSGASASCGLIRTASNFTFLQVYKAGHMVPMDQPNCAVDMVDAWITGTLP